MAYCMYCKTHIFDRSRKCPNCGGTVFLTDDEPAPQPTPPPVQPEVRTVYVDRPVYQPVYQPVYVQQPAQPIKSSCSWLATLLLCFLGGTFGLHRFYVVLDGMATQHKVSAGSSTAQEQHCMHAACRLIDSESCGVQSCQQWDG